MKASCRVTGVWTISDPAVLQPLTRHHIYTPTFIQQRMKWRPGQPLTVVEVAASRFRQPVLVPNSESLWGCFSWTSVADLDLMRAAADAEPAVRSEEWQGLQEELRQALQGAEALLPC